MLNVRINVSKRTCLHNVGFLSRGRSGFPYGVGVPEAGGSKCVCVCVSSITCSSSQQWCVHACPAMLGRTWDCCVSEPANVL